MRADGKRGQRGRAGGRSLPLPPTFAGPLLRRQGARLSTRRYAIVAGVGGVGGALERRAAHPFYFISELLTHKFPITRRPAKIIGNSRVINQSRYSIRRANRWWRGGDGGGIGARRTRAEHVTAARRRRQRRRDATPPDQAFTARARYRCRLWI